MELSSHSEYTRLKSVLIKPVELAFRSASFIQKQWEQLNYLGRPDLSVAIEEYEKFQRLLSNEGCEIHYLPENESLSMDSIYCRDASIVTDYGVVLCHMGKMERAMEPEAQEDFFKQIGLPILGKIKAPGTLEGGDVAWLDQHTLAVGHTYRTNEEGIRQLKSLLEPKGIEVMTVELPHYKGESDVFHLMSIFSPIDADLAVVYSPLMPIKFRKELVKRGFDFVEVPEEEFESMACNVLALQPRKCLVVEGNPITKKRLLEKKCEVIAYSGTHISVFGGGGPTCLTRPLKRLKPE